MKKLILLLLCTSAHMRSMDDAAFLKKKFKQSFPKLFNFYKTTRIKVFYKLYNGDKLWRDGVYHATAIDHLKDNEKAQAHYFDEDGNITFERNDYLYHDDQLANIRFKLTRIYQKSFYSGSCFNPFYSFPWESCCKDFQKFKEKVEKIREE